jgi:hypothetical protein
MVAFSFQLGTSRVTPSGLSLSPLWKRTRFSHARLGPAPPPGRPRLNYDALELPAVTSDHRHLSKEMPVSIQPKQPTAKGPAEWFTGDVFIDAIARGEEPSRVRVSAVRFTPSARTAWHAHAVGQTLYVTEGKGLMSGAGMLRSRSAHRGGRMGTP